MNNMQIYLIGGAVRDSYRDEPTNDYDYVVVNAPANLFPEKDKVGAKAEVYLVPQKKLEELFNTPFPKGTHEVRYARKEVSTGPGYNDFEYITDGVTLREDQEGRDLTINSMAKLLNKMVIWDPFKGIQDIEDKVLRHVSPAFAEDPVRVLRIARLRATMRGPEESSLWTIAHETKVMCYSMRDQLKALTPERIWKEISKVLSYSKDYSALAVFMETLYELRVLDVIFPEVYEMVHCKEGSKHHREANVFVHTVMMLKTNSYNPTTELAILYHDVGKPFTYYTYGASKGHEDPELVDTLLPTWIPAKMRREVLFLIANHTRIYKTSAMSAKTIASLLEKFNTKAQLLNQLSLADADDVGRLCDPGISKGTEVTRITEAWLRIHYYSPRDWIQLQDNPSGSAIQNHVHNTNIRIVNDVFKRDQNE